MTPVEFERMLQAILFFAQRSGPLAAHKLFRLLYAFDVLHAQETGRPAAALMYAAYKPGPVAPHLASFMEMSPPPLTMMVQLPTFRVDGKNRNTIVAREEAPVDRDAFTPRQLRLLERVVVDFGDATWESMDSANVDNGAWRKALARGREQEIRWDEVVSHEDPTWTDKMAAGELHRRRAHHLQSLV
jgi:hypothetical protein